MKAVGIVRRIDELGRVVIPKEIRRIMRIDSGDEIEVSTADGAIVLRRFSTVEEDKRLLKSYCVLIGKRLGAGVAVTDKHTVIATAGVADMENNPISMRLKSLINGRKNVVLAGNDVIPLTTTDRRGFSNQAVYCISKNGDVFGSLILLTSQRLQDSQLQQAELLSDVITCNIPD